nr:M20 family metallopeptidase [Propionibacterium sp.]
MVSSVADLAAALIRLPSVNPPGGEQPVADHLAAHLGAHGLAVERVPVPGHGDALVAVLPGRGAAPARIFTGHLDVVGVSNAERARWAVDPFSGLIRDGRLVGRGAADMKGGVAAMVTAALDLHREGRTPPGDILLVLTTDEEDLMGGAKAVAGHPLLARDADVVVGEPTGLTLCTTGRGRTWATLTLRGATGHGSQASGRNPIQLAADLVAELDAEDFTATAAPDAPASFWRPLAIRAGVEPCVVPDTCTLTIDARLAPDHDPADVWVRLDAALGRLRAAHPALDVDVTVVDVREGWRTPAASGLVGEAKAALDAEGLDPTPGVFAGTTDGTVLRRASEGHGVRDVVICGPGALHAAHRENESVALTELDAAVRLYRRLMERR